jgi:hypothetical protein
VWALIESGESVKRTEAVEVDRWSLESHVSVASVEWRLLLEVELSARFATSSRSVDTSTAATGLVDARVHFEDKYVLIEALLWLWL